MEKLITVLQVIAPIFATLLLGAMARRRRIITPEGIQGMQQFVVKFGLPCVLFNSCLTSDFGAEALTSMALLLPLLALSCLWSFRARRRYPYHNLPLLFTAQESGMLGIPLFMVLFGAEQAFRMGALDVTQAVLGIPVIAILAADAGKAPSPGRIAGQVCTSPLLLGGILGLILNLTGAVSPLNRLGLGQILTQTTGFLAAPVSAVILFTVGYNFSLSRSNRGTILRLSALHVGIFGAICAVIQGVLCCLPQVAAETRWAVLLYCMLPGSFIAPGLGRNEEEYTVASGVCSILTAVALAVFCLIAVLAA